MEFTPITKRMIHTAIRMSAKLSGDKAISSGLSLLVNLRFGVNRAPTHSNPLPWQQVGYNPNQTH